MGGEPSRCELSSAQRIDAAMTQTASDAPPAYTSLRISLSIPSDPSNPALISPTNTSHPGKHTPPSPPPSLSPPVPTANLVRPHILTRASHSDAIQPTLAPSIVTPTDSLASTGFGAQLDVTLGTTSVNILRRTSLTFKDAAGRRMGRGSCPNPVSAVKEGMRGGVTPYNTPDRCAPGGTGRYGQLRVQTISPVAGQGEGAVVRRPSWKISLPSPVLTATDMDRAFASDDSINEANEGARLIVESSDETIVEQDENAARRTTYDRTPYPMDEEDENVDPFSAAHTQSTSSGLSSVVVPVKSLQNALCRIDLHALHPADRPHGPDFDSGSQSPSDSESDLDDDDGLLSAEHLTGGKEVRQSLLRMPSAVTTVAHAADHEGAEDDVEFIDPFSGSRISSKAANSQILSKSGGSSFLKSGNPVLIRKSSFTGLGRPAGSGLARSPSDGINDEMQSDERTVPGLPVAGSKSRIAAFFTRSRTPSATVTKEGSSVGKSIVIGGVHGTAGVDVKDSQEWISAGMSKQWSVDSQSAMEGDGLLV